tara:strand:- start:3346 stop:3612 length:267 start_codon:yes stop_codon:yes gene_type:complete
MRETLKSFKLGTVKSVVKRQIHKCRELMAQQYGQKYDAPTLTYRLPELKSENQRLFEMGINIGWIEGLEFVKNWLDAEIEQEDIDYDS